MYLSFYGLAAPPFHVTPDPEYLYLSPSHREALASIAYAVDNGKGFALVVGEVGTGKTTVAREYLVRLNPERVKAVYLVHPIFTFKELVRIMLRDLGEYSAGRDLTEMLARLERALAEEQARGRKVVLIMDDAQNLPIPMLEHLRTLSNLETAKHKLLQIVLIGQPELADKLARHELRQLAQRLAFRTTIRPLTFRESIDYLRHRVVLAGASLRDVLSNEAIRAIVRCAGGIPRSLNILCDNALIEGFAAQERPVTRTTAERGIQGLARAAEGRYVFLKRAGLGIAACAMIAAGGLMAALPMSRTLGYAAARAAVEQPPAAARPTNAAPAPREVWRSSHREEAELPAAQQADARKGNP